MELTHFFNNLSLEEKDEMVSRICTLETIKTNLTPYAVSQFTSKHYDEFSEFLYEYLEDTLDEEDVDDAYDSTMMWFNPTNYTEICNKIILNK